VFEVWSRLVSSTATGREHPIADQLPEPAAALPELVDSDRGDPQG